MPLFDLLHYSFIQRGIVAGLCIAILAPTVGMFVVAKRYAMISDTLAHVALAALSLSIVLHSAPLPTIAIATVLASLGIEYLRNSGRFSGEQVLSLFLSGSLSVAIIIMSITNTSGIQGILFGSLATVSRNDVATILVATAAVLCGTLLLFPQLLSTVFHDELARINGVRVKQLHYFIVISAALTITLSLRIVGGLLVGALMVIPVLAAHQLRLSFGKTTIAAVLCAILSVIFGFIFSILWNVPSGATIVLCALMMCTLASLYRYVKTA